jgi:hypothetical protein
VANVARHRLAAPTPNDQRFSFFDRAGRYIGDEPGAAITILELREIFGDLDDPVSDRLLFVLTNVGEKPSGNESLRHDVRFHDADALARFQ